MIPAPVSKLGYVEIRTSNVERLTHHYETVLGLMRVPDPSPAAYLTTGRDHHCVVIAEGAPNGRARLGFELACGLDDADDALRAAKVPAERRSHPEPGIPDAIEVREAVTGTPLTLYETQAPSGLTPGITWRPAKLGHLAGYVGDLAAVRAFYEQVLGFRWADSVGDFFVFLRCNRDHHAANFIESQTRSGLFHLAFEMRDMLHLKDALDTLAAHDVRLDWGPGRHGPGHNVFTYHRDPDGNIVELFTELDVIADERTGYWEPRLWHETSPMGPRVWAPTDEAANAWGPQNPDPDFLTD